MRIKRLATIRLVIFSVLVLSIAFTASSNAATYSTPPAVFGSSSFFQQAYDLQALAQTAGYGDTVGIVDVGTGYAPESDLSQFRAANGLPPCTSASGCLNVVNQTGGSTLLTQSQAQVAGNNSDWGSEIAEDLDAVSSICPNCHLLLVEANSETANDLIATEHTADQLGANQISNSWAEDGSWFNYHADSKDFVFPGVATVASAGDDGFLDQDFSFYPAAYSGVTAVGGTATFLSQTPTARGLNEQGSSYDTSFCSAEPQPAWQSTDNGGCPKRAVSDISADGETDTGLNYYYSPNGSLTGYSAGGTSLSAALVAGYYALIESTPQGKNYGIDGAQWAYQNPALLNDITSADGDGTDDGPNGSCPQNWISICQVGPGYDGVTGVGSITGAVVPGAPGVTTAEASCSCADQVGHFDVSSEGTSVTLEGGVYPNQLDTQYWWEYGPTTAYGSTTAAQDVGAGASPVLVSNTITNLTAGTTYHYALVASNSMGTVSYDPGVGSTVSQVASLPPIAPVAPILITRPSISGKLCLRKTLIASAGTWSSPGSTQGLTYAYQWEKRVGGKLVVIPGATKVIYKLAHKEKAVRVVITATSAGGSVTHTSAVSKIRQHGCQVTHKTHKRHHRAKAASVKTAPKMGPSIFVSEEPAPQR